MTKLCPRTSTTSSFKDSTTAHEATFNGPRDHTGAEDFLVGGGGEGGLAGVAVLIRMVLALRVGTDTEPEERKQATDCKIN